MKQYHWTEYREDARYIGVVTVDGPFSHEEVRRATAGEIVTVHETNFATRNLGTAYRDEYTRVMVASVADADMRGRKVA